jgi:hypothetical protein
LWIGDMMDSRLDFVVSQLIYYGAPLALYAVGIVLGLAFLRRYPAAAGLVLGACGLMLVATVAIAGVSWYVFEIQESGSSMRYASLMSWVGMAGSLVRVAALAMLLAAAFVGRRAPGWDKPPKQPI